MRTSKRVIISLTRGPGRPSWRQDKTNRQHASPNAQGELPKGQSKGDAEAVNLTDNGAS